MKRILLDTHVLLWWLIDSPKLGVTAREAIAAADNVVYVSAASIWEIAIKKSLGKLRAPDNFDHILEQEGFEELPVSVYHAEQAGGLPAHHRDPFDRMLIAQAQAEGLLLLSQDKQISAYGIRTANPLV
jgi:PIN domain nuclease of toxin-antitoxin system